MVTAHLLKINNNFMKKIIKQMAIMMAILMIAFFTTNCKKDSSNPSDGTKTDTTGVYFNINPITQNGSYKSTLDVPPCSQLKATKVDITLLGGIYTTPTTISLDVFYIGNLPYTKALKLDAGHYTIKEFLMYNVNNNTTTLLSATPHAGSTYVEFLSNPSKSIDMGFDVIAFKKTEMKMEVVCYTIENYSNFGFTYYQIDEIIVRKQYFYGDLCIKDLSDYANTPYTDQGLRYDLIAIFKIKVKRTTGGGVVQNYEYYSGTWPANGNNTPLEVQYGDFKNSNDHFVFELWALVRQGSGTGYKLFKTWEFDNQSNITEGSDNVVDFVIGNCVQSATDYHFEPYINLPATCSFSIQMGTLSYFDVTLSNFIPAGNYDIVEGLNHGYCGDLYHYINLGQTYTMNVYSSLYLNEIPDGLYAKTINWGRLNWLINNLDQFPGYSWQELQAAIWRETNGESWLPTTNGITFDGVAQSMYAGMVAHGTGYSPLPGGWACIIFVDQQGGNSTQLQFIKIDP